MLLNQIKNENSRFGQESNEIKNVYREFTKPVYHKTFFKTPLSVNNCVEAMIGPTIYDADYATGLVLQELLTYTFLTPLIREKGGAYGAGCTINESGFISFYSYSDPKIVKTYENFERAI